MRIVPTQQGQALTKSVHPNIDLSLETPDAQFEALVSMLEKDDAAHPAPFTGTPPWGEPIHEFEYIPESVQEHEYMPAPDMQSSADIDLLSVMSDAHPADIPEWDWENDDQYFGLGVPPGVPNYGQPIESGHTQITPPDPSAEHGWDAWSGRPVLARVARHENNFTRYNAGNSRGHMLPIHLLQNRRPADYRTQQARDLLLAEIKRRGIHNVVIADVPAQSYTEQVTQVEPWAMMPEEIIGPEGVLP